MREALAGALLLRAPSDLLLCACIGYAGASAVALQMVSLQGSAKRLGLCPQKCVCKWLLPHMPQQQAEASLRGLLCSQKALSADANEFRVVYQ